MLENKQDESLETDDKKTNEFLEIAVNEVFFLKKISDRKVEEPNSSMTEGQKLLWINSKIIIKT